MEAALGVRKDVSVTVKAECDTCSGTGSADGRPPVTCGSCNGTGEQIMRNGFFEVRATCRACSGSGTVIANKCGSCGGAGVRSTRKSVEVVVPAGVDDDTTLRLAGQGDKGEQGGPSGHLYVQLRVEKHRVFEREGAHIHVRVPVSMTQAVLGDSVTVPTVRGDVDLKIPPGTQPDDKLVMRGRGIERLNGGARGSQYVHVSVRLPDPTTLTAEQRALLERFRDIELGRASPASGGAADGAAGAAAAAAGGAAAASGASGDASAASKGEASAASGSAEAASSASSASGPAEHDDESGFLGEALRRLRKAVSSDKKQGGSSCADGMPDPQRPTRGRKRRSVMDASDSSSSSEDEQWDRLR
ncbi:hypothetical protein FNF27_07445 [Cafeteria roenbergensis]|uniref:CR-type domain-containing protein n=1 Tax=Cafeteria roenbergensis TaxID=33653 RepID=A0A5A8DMP1_CAFRO|nr:hypothetical protein FNF27_07445 [Cafeteria roenbergensis]